MKMRGRWSKLPLNKSKTCKRGVNNPPKQGEKTRVNQSCHFKRLDTRHAHLVVQYGKISVLTFLVFVLKRTG